MTTNATPLHSLQSGNWFKLICGASYQHLPMVRSLALAYTLAGADCIDVAADPAVIAVAHEAIQVAQTLGNQAQAKGFGFKGQPWLMVSVNDGEDPHFRKAVFNPEACPTDCWRPCEPICPTKAISFSESSLASSGVIEQLCYGCGRCINVCPSQLIQARSSTVSPAVVLPTILQMGIDAIEIHTQVGRVHDFKQLWKWVHPWVDRLRLVAISCPDEVGLVDYLWELYRIVSPLPCNLIWQTDGRPMSGDIGAGTTHASIKLAQKVLNAGLPGYVQLAGGTNGYTVSKLRALGLLSPPNHDPTQKGSVTRSVAGIAYGSYARTLLSSVLEILELNYTSSPGIELTSKSSSKYPDIEFGLTQLEAKPELLWQATDLANALISQIKGCDLLAS
ncbi:MAG: circadian clock protein LdpA [Microcoleaceae cyanobacterium]